jgi:UDP-N-acetylglucosamine acyltransferase
MEQNTKMDSTQIHPTAIVHPKAELASGVQVGPYSIIEENVKIGEGTRVGARVTIEGRTTFGKNNEIFSGAVIGSVTQDKKYKGGKTFLNIGDNNKIREYVTINPGTEEGTETFVGNGNLIMAYSHIAHDCIVKNNTVLANAATLAGHVTIDDGAILGGLSGVHQFIHIGSLAIVGGLSKVTQDIPPFVMVDGHPATAFGINKVGLERAGYSQEDRNEARKAFKIIFKQSRSLQDALQTLESDLSDGNIKSLLLDFLRSCKHGICRPH